MNLAVVVPTYNEKENIQSLIEKLSSIKEVKKIIIVDDNSPDGTTALVTKLKETHPQLEVVVREGKGGRGSAALVGLKKAFEDPMIEGAVEMDADLSHDPADIKKMLAKAAEGFDVVIGSRYIPGSVVLGRERWRELVSRSANKLAAVFLGLPISDYTNLYRLYSKKAAEKMENISLGVKGFAATTEAVYRLYHLGFRVAEVPTTFVNRKKGKSNLSLGELIAAGLLLIRLRVGSAKK